MDEEAEWELLLIGCIVLQKKQGYKKRKSFVLLRILLVNQLREWQNILSIRRFSKCLKVDF